MWQYRVSGCPCGESGNTDDSEGANKATGGPRNRKMQQMSQVLAELSLFEGIMDLVFGHHEISFPQRGQTEVVILFKVEAEANSIEGQSGQIEQFREIQSVSFLWKEIKISIWVSTKLAKTLSISWRAFSRLYLRISKSKKCLFMNFDSVKGAKHHPF